MTKNIVHGLPINGQHNGRAAILALQGGSFLASYWYTREGFNKLGNQVEQAIKLVGNDGVFLLDNGAFTAFKQGIDITKDEAYLDDLYVWAEDVMSRCPQAMFIIPDCIDGDEDDNAGMVSESRGSNLDPERCVPVWHLHESFEYLQDLLMEYNNIAIGSSGQFWKVNSTEWQDRINEMFAFMDGLFADPEFAAAYVRPKLHMLRGIAVMDSFRFDSADSVNVAVNHGRQAKKGEDLDAFISRVEGKASQGEGHGDAIIGTAAEISAELERHIRFFVKENEEVDVVHVQDFDLAVELLCPVMAESKYAAAILGEPAATVLTMDCTVKHVTNEEALGRTLR